MRSIAVFCASSLGINPVYEQTAYDTGAKLASEGITVVYGGSRIGLMGALANGALEHGGLVIGVLPRFMQNKEIAHDGLSELIMVDSMQERKLRMHELSEGVIALPGGFGTFEELFEMLTWGQLGLHSKPIGLLNVAGYYLHLEAMMDHMVREGLLKQSNRDMVLVEQRLEPLLELMHRYEPPPPVVKMDKKQA